MFEKQIKHNSHRIKRKDFSMPYISKLACLESSPFNDSCCYLTVFLVSNFLLPQLRWIKAEPRSLFHVKSTENEETHRKNYILFVSFGLVTLRVACTYLKLRTVSNQKRYRFVSLCMLFLVHLKSNVHVC